MTGAAFASYDSDGPATYRAFLLGPCGHVLSAEIVSARGDDEAKAAVATMDNRYGIDLWERGRFLASYPPRSGVKGVTAFHRASGEVRHAGGSSAHEPADRDRSIRSRSSPPRPDAPMTDRRRPGTMA